MKFLKVVVLVSALGLAACSSTPEKREIVGEVELLYNQGMDLLTEETWCAVALHPESGQHRVTLTGPVIEAADRVCFLIAGRNKADVLATILAGNAGREKFPTSHVVDSCDAQMYIDAAAGAKLDV